MAITTYAELQTAVNSWAVKSDTTAQVKELIALGEAGLNRKIQVSQTDATLTGVVDTSALSVSALALVEAYDLYIVPDSGEEIPLQKQRAGEYGKSGTSGQPAIWSVDGTNIVFNRPLNAAYSFRLRYRGRFALTDVITSNWLLLNHPDVYLAASMVWGHGFHKSFTVEWPAWKGILEEGVSEVKREISRLNKGTLRVDPALMAQTRRFDYVTGQ